MKKHKAKEKRRKEIGGWSQWIVVDGTDVWIQVKRSRYTGRKWGRPTFTHTGYVIRDGRVLWAGTVPKSITVQELVNLGIQ